MKTPKYTVHEGNTPSPAELQVIAELDRLKVKWVREVAFVGCINPETKRQLRYDFYLPEFNLLLEYDGKNYHSDADVRFRDRIKNGFAQSRGMLLVRLYGYREIRKKITEAIAGIVPELKKIKKPSREELVPNLSREKLQFITSGHKLFDTLSTHDKKFILFREGKTLYHYKKGVTSTGYTKYIPKPRKLK